MPLLRLDGSGFSQRLESPSRRPTRDAAPHSKDADYYATDEARVNVFTPRRASGIVAAVRLTTAVLMLTACSGGDTVTPVPMSVLARVNVSLSSASVQIGQSATATAAGVDQRGAATPIPALVWSSSNTAVATIAQNGVITAVSVGSTSIIASAGSITGQAVFSVIAGPVTTTINVSLAASTLEVGKTTSATASVLDQFGSSLSGRPMVWSTASPAVATVNPSTGIVTAVGAGTTVVIASADGKQGQATLTVLPPQPVATVRLVLPSDLIIEGATTEIAQVVSLSAAGDTLTGRPAVWSSSNTNVATIDATGRISALSPGRTNLTVVVEGKSATTTIKVEWRSQYGQKAGGGWEYLDTIAEPRMPTWSNALGGRVPRATDTRPQITIDESFTVPAGQQATWENTIVWIRSRQRRNITVGGSLIIKNSLILWDQTQAQQAPIEVLGGGRLRVENSYAFSNNAFSTAMQYDDGSVVSFDHFQTDLWSAIAGGSVSYTAVNGSTVQVSLWGSTVNTAMKVSDAGRVYLELLLPPGTFQLTLPPKETWEDWHLPSIWPGTEVNVVNSYVFERDVTLNYGTHVTVKDTPSGFSVGWAIGNSSSAYVNCTLRNLGKPGDVNGILAQDSTWDLPCTNSSLRLINSRIWRAWPFTTGKVHLKVYDSYLTDATNYGQGATYEVYGSTVVGISSWNGGRVYIENSDVSNYIHAVGDGSVIYSYHLLPSTAPVFEESGGRYIRLSSQGPPWP